MSGGSDTVNSDGNECYGNDECGGGGGDGTRFCTEGVKMKVPT